MEKGQRKRKGGRKKERGREKEREDTELWNVKSESITA